MDPLFELALTVKAIDRELQRRVNEVMLPLGITGPQADALVVIGQAERISLKELGGLLIAEGGHPSRLVDRLVEAGLVERSPAEDDRRRTELSLTRAGRRMERRVVEAREALTDVGRQLISPRDLDAALKALRQLLQHTANAPLVSARAELERGRTGT